MDIEPIIETFVIYKSQKVPILSGCDEISRLHCLSLGYLNKKKANQGRI